MIYGEKIVNNVTRRRYQFGAQDAIANRVYQAFERLQLAWYTANARHPANETPQLDEAASVELKAAEEEWLAARAAVCAGY